MLRKAQSRAVTPEASPMANLLNPSTNSVGLKFPLNMCGDFDSPHISESGPSGTFFQVPLLIDNPEVIESMAPAF